jgi:hypothetical protein
MSFIADGRVGAAVAVSTGATGTGTWLEMIPENIGRLGTLVGIVLSLVLIVVHLRKMRLDAIDAKYRAERNKLEIAQLKWKMEQEKKLAESKTDPAA